MCCLVAAIAVVGCGGGDDEPVIPGMLDGSVMKGAVVDAQVSISEFNTPDQIQILLVAETDASGAWQADRPDNSNPPYLLVSSGGSYDDEKNPGDDVNIDPTTEMYGFIPAGSDVGQVTPLTHALYFAVIEKVKNGKSPAIAMDEVTQGLTGLGFNPFTTRPAKNGTAAQKKYAVLLGGFSYAVDELISTDPAFDARDRFTLVLALALDMADGLLDGLDIAGSTVMVDALNAMTPLGSHDDEGVSWLVDHANTYARDAGLPELTDTVKINTVDFRFEVIVLDGDDIPLPGYRVSAWNRLPCELSIGCPAANGAQRPIGNSSATVRPSSTINYVVEKASNIDITIYDLDGNAVRTLVDEPRDANAYSVGWNALMGDGNSAPAGTYKVRMTATSDAGTTLFTDEVCGTLYTFSMYQETDFIALTDDAGFAVSEYRKRFPRFHEDLPGPDCLIATTGEGVPFGTYTYTDSVTIAVTDPSITQFQQFAVTIKDGLNRFKVQLTDLQPLFGSSPPVSSTDERVMHMEPSGESDVSTQESWGLTIYPNPFN